MESKKQYRPSPAPSYYETHLVGCSSPHAYHTETRPSWHKINDDECSEFCQNPEKLVGQKFTQEGGQEIWEIAAVTLMEDNKRYAVLECEEREKHRMLVDDLLRMLKEGKFTVAEIL